MGLLEIILIAIGLSMDALAVSVTLGLTSCGLSAKKIKARELLIPGLYFGFFQAAMPALGYFCGYFFADKLDHFAHWIAFVLLGFIGGKMIKDSLAKEEEKKIEYSFAFGKMLILAIATSIDALAVGITYAFYKVNILQAAVLTGLITFVICVIGVKIGSVLGTKFQSKAAFAGGLVLVIIGLKAVVEHYSKTI